jgi:hypothetical protein
VQFGRGCRRAYPATGQQTLRVEEQRRFLVDTRPVQSAMALMSDGRPRGGMVQERGNASHCAGFDGVVEQGANATGRALAASDKALQDLAVSCGKLLPEKRGAVVCIRFDGQDRIKVEIRENGGRHEVQPGHLSAKLRVHLGLLLLVASPATEYVHNAVNMGRTQLEGQR